MKVRSRAFVGCLVLACVGAAGGCSSYYRVMDPAGDRMYYTKSIDDYERSGAVKFTDDRTGSVVTLQSSEVKEITKAEYDAAMKQKAK